MASSIFIKTNVESTLEVIKVVGFNGDVNKPYTPAECVVLVSSNLINIVDNRLVDGSNDALLVVDLDNDTWRFYGSRRQTVSKRGLTYHGINCSKTLSLTENDKSILVDHISRFINKS